MAETCDPLKPGDCAQLNHSLDLNAKAQAILDRLKAVGIPCDEYQDQNTAMGEICRGIKQQFFPLSK